MIAGMKRKLQIPPTKVDIFFGVTKEIPTHLISAQSNSGFQSLYHFESRPENPDILYDYEKILLFLLTQGGQFPVSKFFRLDKPIYDDSYSTFFSNRTVKFLYRDETPLEISVQDLYKRFVDNDDDSKRIEYFRRSLDQTIHVDVAGLLRFVSTHFNECVKQHGDEGEKDEDEKGEEDEDKEDEDKEDEEYKGEEDEGEEDEEDEEEESEFDSTYSTDGEEDEEEESEFDSTRGEEEEEEESNFLKQ